MKNVLLSVVAICIAGVAAVAATTAMLNSPVKPAYIGAPKDQPADPNAPPQPSSTPPSVPAPAPAPVPTDNRGTPAPAPTTSPDAGAPAGAKPANPADAEDDKDPYEGIAPEELPPDLQYDADSSVSFPTNI